MELLVSHPRQVDEVVNRVDELHLAVGLEERDDHEEDLTPFDHAVAFRRHPLPVRDVIIQDPSGGGELDHGGQDL